MKFAHREDIALPTMTITRIRRRWATNSSSTHSILELEPGQELPPPIHRDWREPDRHFYPFVISDRPSKIAYLQAMAADGACDGVNRNDVAEWRRRYLQLAAVIPGPPLDVGDMVSVSIDNLEGYAIPRKIHTRDMDVDFFERIVRLVLSETVVVYGDGFGPELPWEGKVKGQFRHLLGGCGLVSRRVSENEWTLLNSYDGKKFSVRFDESGRQTADRQEPRALEMVDVSITNACRRLCPFCYRASVPGGPAADIRHLKALVDGLKDADVMEMVIGGGEPTEHPEFYHFLLTADFGDLGVSFTTRDLDLVRSLSKATGHGESELLFFLRKNVNAIGLSVRTVEDVKEAERNLPELLDGDYRITNPQPVFHFIPGPGWEAVLDALNEKRRPALLLGMKFTGRNAGADHRAYAEALKAMLPDERFKAFLEQHSCQRGRLGVDTQFIVDAAAIDPEWLKRFRRESWSDMEGERSAFIDLVDGTMAPCSFGGERVKLEGYGAPALLDVFGRIGTYRPTPCGS